jgi:hypothetical protein
MVLRLPKAAYRLPTLHEIEAAGVLREGRAERAQQRREHVMRRERDEWARIHAAEERSEQAQQ